MYTLGLAVNLLSNVAQQRNKVMVDRYPDLERILISPEAIHDRVVELAAEIEKDYKDVERLYMIGILKGAFIFLADLTRQLHLSHIVDFMALSSYGKTTTVGEVRILMDTREPMDGEHILVVEDIVDSGLTLSYLTHILQRRNPASLRTCALVRKKREQEQFALDYCGFEIPDVWVVGYGLDYADRYRTLPFVAELKHQVYSK
jgi:hypoxanthine phosphoribosyltransferase